MSDLLNESSEELVEESIDEIDTSEDKNEEDSSETEELIIQNVIYENDHIKIIQDDDAFQLLTLKVGFPFDKFKEILKDFPQISVPTDATVKGLLGKVSDVPQVFGVIQPRIEIEMSADKMEAYITLHLDEKEYKTKEGLQSLLDEIRTELNTFGIVHGISLEDKISFNTPIDEKILIAIGTEVINGEDSIIKMYEVAPPKPEIKDDGTADFYSINLIHSIKEGDWLGERLDATSGTPGTTVDGVSIVPNSGKQLNLDYDKKSVSEVYDEESNKTTLYSLKTGAIFYNNNTIEVKECFTIDKNLDYSTGNIDFNGFVIVNGTVDDNFELTATKDIEINSQMGVGKIKKIESTDGSLSIQGGIAGKNEAVIQAKQNIYLKFATETKIRCEGTLHVGFYCYNCDIEAKEVILEGSHTRLIGGRVVAKTRVTTDEIGNNTAALTYVKVEGYDNEEFKKELEKTTAEIEKINETIEKIKNETTKEKDKVKVNELKNSINQAKGNLKYLRELEKEYKSYIKDPGEGSIHIKKKIHSNTILEIKEKMKMYRDDVDSQTTLYYENDDLHEG
ncbi:MAG: FapA family protein [Clostridia bacterium]|nr:FapA family protein [Clostridia bacterium]